MLKALRIYASSPPAPVSPDHEVRPGGQAASTGSGASGAPAAPGKASAGYAGASACKDFSVTVKEGTFAGKDTDTISFEKMILAGSAKTLSEASFRMTVMLVPLTSEGKPASQNVISKTFCNKEEGFGKVAGAKDGEPADESKEGCIKLPASFADSFSLTDLGVSVTVDKTKGGPFFYAFKGAKEFKIAENEKVQVKVFMRQWIAVKSASAGAADEKKYCPTGTTNDGKTGAVSASYGATGLKPAKKVEAKQAPAPSSSGTGSGSGSSGGTESGGTKPYCESKGLGKCKASCSLTETRVSPGSCGTGSYDKGTVCCKAKRGGAPEPKSVNPAASGCSTRCSASSGGQPACLSIRCGTNNCKWVGSPACYKNTDQAIAKYCTRVSGADCDIKGGRKCSVIVNRPLPWPQDGFEQVNCCVFIKASTSIGACKPA